jgi:hypothetical protein
MIMIVIVGVILVLLNDKENSKKKGSVQRGEEDRNKSNKEYCDYNHNIAI